MDNIKFLKGLGSSSKLDIAEYVSLAGSLAGAVAAAASQQVLYAAAPLTLALSLSLANRQRSQQQLQQLSTSVSADVQMVVKSLERQVQMLPTAEQFNDLEASMVRLSGTTQQLEQVFNTRPEPKTIDQLERTNALVKQRLDDLNPLHGAIPQIQTDLQSLQKQIVQQEKQDETLEEAVKQLQLRFQIVRHLCSEIGGLKLQQRRQSQIGELQPQLENQDVSDANRHDYTRQLEQDIETLSQQIEILSQENEAFKVDMGQHPLDSFERLILTCLQNGLPQQEVIAQFDAGIGRDNSKFIDFVVVMNNCIIALEAKSYKGIIEPVGDPRNSNWRCQTKSGNILINACWGLNPYQQVKTYVDSLLDRIDSRSRKQRPNLPVYGIVVFPNGTNIAPSIESNVGGFYRVTTLNKLLEVIRSLETQAQSQNTSRMSYKNILNIFTGTSSRNAA